MRPLLALESSGKSLGVALRAESGIVFHENVTAGSIHGKALAPLIEKALRENGLKASDLEAVAVSLGPGSWTGLRIGISAAKALAWGANTGLIGVPSFEALALDAAAHATGHARLTLRDARSEGFFVALFDETSPQPQRWIPECVLQPAECVQAVETAMRNRPNIPLAACGDAVCLEQIAGDAQRNGWNLLRACEHISGRAIAECGWRRLQEGAVLKTAADIHKLAPLYLRASDPELKLRRPAAPIEK